MDHAAGHDFTYKQYPKRWRMLATIFALNLGIQIFFITFAPIASLSAVYFNVDVTAINWLALVWIALFLPSTVLAGWATFKYGLRNCLIASGMVLLVGSGLRVVSVAFRDTTDSSSPNGPPSKDGPAAYTFLLIGTMIIATVQPIILSSTTFIASAWFSETQRNLANTLMAIANPLGMAIGSLLSPIFASETNPEGINKLLGLQAGLAALLAFSTFFIESHPPTAPAATAAYKRPGANLGRDLKSLKNNFGFMTLCNIFSLAVGALTALLTLLEQILRPKGYDSDTAGLISAVLILSGIIGCAIVGPIMDHYRAYKLVLVGSLTLTFPCYVAFTYFTQQPDQKTVLLVLAGFTGLFGFPVLPVALDLSAEITYPIGAALTSAILWCGSQVTALVLIVLADGPLSETIERDIDSKLADESGVVSLTAGAWLLVGCVACATALSWIWSGRYVRREAEGTVQRLRQAQRRDTGLPFVDIISEPEHQNHNPFADNNLSPSGARGVTGNATAVAVVAAAGGVGGLDGVNSPLGQSMTRRGGDVAQEHPEL